jgi:hypothetical protein
MQPEQYLYLSELKGTEAKWTTVAAIKRNETLTTSFLDGATVMKIILFSGM